MTFLVVFLLTLPARGAQAQGGARLSRPAAAPSSLKTPGALPAAATPLSGPSALPASLSLTQAALAPAPGTPATGLPAPLAAARALMAAPAAVPAAVVPSGASPLKSLEAIQAGAPPARSGLGSQVSAGIQSFDGGALRAAMDFSSPVEPAFESLNADVAPLAAPDVEVEPMPDLPKIGFPIAMKGALLNTDKDHMIYGAIKVIRNEGSAEYWSAYKRGAKINIVSRDENVFGRPTTITEAYTKSIGDLDREDLLGAFPAYQLQLPLRELRKLLLKRLNDTRAAFNSTDPIITLSSKVRVIKFKSYLDLYREVHGPDSFPEPAVPAERTPLKVVPEGALKPLSRFLPRAIFLDLDLFDKPLSPELLSDMSKLQRTGVYFVALSRKPYAAPGGMYEKLIRPMSAYQLTVQMPIRFLAVTDDGAVISALPKGGFITPVDVAAFNDAEMDSLRDAARRAAEIVGIPPKALQPVAQPAIAERATEFGGAARKAPLKDPQVRFELLIPKTVSPETLARWTSEFKRLAELQGVAPYVALEFSAGAKVRLVAQKTNLASSMGRLNEAIGEQFGIYLNPGHAMVLSEDPALLAAANNGGIDMNAATGLRGPELVENALGLLLGEHRQNMAGDYAGSATRMMQYSRNRKEYLSEILRQQDKDETAINFYSGHVVHSANDWLVWNLQNNRVPTKAAFEAHLRKHWDKGLREFKAVTLPPGERMEGRLDSAVRKALLMYDLVLAARARGEIFIGTEIPNFFMVKDYQRRSGNLKARYVMHAVFDFVALRPIKGKPGHYALVIYDFKTGPAQSKSKFDRDLQVLTYTYFAREKWLGQEFPVPYFAGKETVHIDAVAVEFFYNNIKQASDVNDWAISAVRSKFIRTLNSIRKSEEQLLGEPDGKLLRKRRQDRRPKRR